MDVTKLGVVGSSSDLVRGVVLTIAYGGSFKVKVVRLLSLKILSTIRGFQLSHEFLDAYSLETALSGYCYVNLSYMLSLGKVLGVAHFTPKPK